MKRPKPNVLCVSPSSSTPALPCSPFGNRNSDIDSSMDYVSSNYSPTCTKNRSNFISPLQIDTHTSARLNSSHSSNILSSDQSPDGGSGYQHLTKSFNGTGYPDHISQSVSYARRMESKAHHISNRIHNASSISMSPRLLFTQDSLKDESSSCERSKRSSYDDLSMHTYHSISQQTLTSVERFLRYAEICPDSVREKTPNRFMEKFVPGESNSPYIKPKCFDPVFNSNCSIHEMYNEVQALSLLQHKNVINYYSSWFESEAIYLQLEYCLGGSLFHLIYPDRVLDTSHCLSSDYTPDFSDENMNECVDNPSPKSNKLYHSVRRLGEKPLLVLTAHIISALNYIHTNWSLVHGDVKPSNILIQLLQPTAYLASSKDVLKDVKSHTQKMLLNDEVRGIVFKLADFGRSSRAGEDRDGEDLGDGRFLPALNDPSPPARAAAGRDIYALGITLYNAAGGEMRGDSWSKFRETGYLPDISVLPNCLLPIIKGILRPFAKDRPTAAELIKQPLLRPFICPQDENFEPIIEL